MKILKGVATLFAVSWMIFPTLVFVSGTARIEEPRFKRFVPTPPPEAYRLSVWRTAPLEVAKVFGRSPACADADSELIAQVARAAVTAGVEPNLLAATVAVESGCDPFAVSRKGAIGLTQVMPRIWAGRFDIQGRMNLLNPRDNLRVGSEILASLVQEHGVHEGVRRYQGLGVGCETCDGQYASKILVLAGRKGGKE